MIGSLFRDALVHRHWAAAGYLVGWQLAGTLPDPVARSLTRWGADCATKRGIGTRQLRRNLARVVGEDNVSEELIRDAMRSYGRYWMEAFRLPRLSKNPEVLRRIDKAMRGKEYLAASVASGRGVIIVLPHSGNWDAAGVELTRLHGRFTTVNERLKPEVLYQGFVEFREGLGFEVLPHRQDDGSGPYQVLKQRLDDGGIVCLLGERDLRASGVRVSFFGETALFPAGAVRLALDTGAALHVAHSWFPAPGQWGLSVSAPVQVTNIADTTQRVAEIFERNIRAHPADWHMLQPLWLRDLDLRRLDRAREERSGDTSQ